MSMSRCTRKRSRYKMTDRWSIPDAKHPVVRKTLLVKISMFRHRNRKTEHLVKVIITSLKRGRCRNKTNRNIYLFSYHNYFEIALCIFYKLSLETKQICLGIFCRFLGRRIFQMYEPLFLLKQRNVWQKTTKYCKAIILQLKKEKENFLTQRIIIKVWVPKWHTL